MSPTIDRVGPYRIFFYSNEGVEPPHVHIQEGRSLAKFWLGPVRLAGSRGFAAHELTKLEALVADNEKQYQEAWDEFFSS